MKLVLPTRQSTAEGKLSGRQIIENIGEKFQQQLSAIFRTHISQLQIARASQKGFCLDTLTSLLVTKFSVIRHLAEPITFGYF